MSEIDLILREKDIPIPGRTVHALCEAGTKLGIEVLIAPIKSAPIEGVYEGESLSAHIVKWVQDRYGERLKMDLSIGHALILIRGTPWLLKFPWMVGSVRMVCERDLSKEFQNFVVYKSGEPHPKPIMNLLLCIRDLPQSLVNDLSDDELREILDYFLVGNEFFIRTYRFFKDAELLLSGIRDVKSSAEYCVDSNSTHGLSRWASLQSAEKFLKFYIEQSGEQFPHTHDLKRLANQAYGLGLPLIEETVLDHIQCNASVRYESLQHKTLDVVKAHQNALMVGVLAMNTLTEI